MAGILVTPGLYTAFVEHVTVGTFEGLPCVAVRFYSPGGQGQPPFRGLTRVAFRLGHPAIMSLGARAMRAMGFEGDDLHTLDPRHPHYQNLNGNKFTLEAITRTYPDRPGWPGDTRSVFAVYAPVDPEGPENAAGWAAVANALRAAK